MFATLDCHTGGILAVSLRISKEQEQTHHQRQVPFKWQAVMRGNYLEKSDRKTPHGALYEGRQRSDAAEQQISWPFPY